MAHHTGFSPGDSMAGSSLNVTSSGSYNSPQPPLKTAKNNICRSILRKWKIMCMPNITAAGAVDREQWERVHVYKKG